MRLIPAYKEVLFSLAANASYTLNRVGDVVAFLSVSGGPYVMQIDDGEESDVRAGITYKMPPGSNFRRLVFRDTGGVGGDIRIAIARGSITDARSTITGSFPVQNAEPPDNILDVQLAAADAGLVALYADLATDLAAIIANQNDDAAKRAALNTFSGATYRTNSGIEDAEVVSAAANTSGIIIRRAWIIQKGGTPIETNIKAGGNIICGTKSVDLAYWDAIEKYFIPAGVNLSSKTTHATTSFTFLWYEVL